MSLVSESRCFGKLTQCWEGDHMGIRLALSDHQPAARFENSMKFTECALTVWDFSQCCHQICGVEGAVRVREILRVTEGGDYVLHLSLASPVCRMVEHLLPDVQDLQRPAR